jgi:hypothetical protein
MEGLLQHVSTISKETWSSQDEYINIWDEVHNTLIDSLARRLDSHVNNWHNTDAGRKFKADVDHQRYELVILDLANVLQKSGEKDASLL